MNFFNKLAKRNYKAVINRGLISDKTNENEFIDKMTEELEEIIFEADRTKRKDEVVDLMSVCVNYLIHYGYNPKKEFKLNATLKNERRSR